MYYLSCACNVLGHNYKWSFEPKLDWTAVHASSQQIFEYFEVFARKYHLHDFVKTEHQVSGAFRNKELNGYDVKVQDLKIGTEITDHCDILTNASGILNHWRWPPIPGLKDFKGTLLHTASWDEKSFLMASMLA